MTTQKKTKTPKVAEPEVKCWLQSLIGKKVVLINTIGDIIKFNNHGKTFLLKEIDYAANLYIVEKDDIIIGFSFDTVKAITEYKEELESV